MFSILIPVYNYSIIKLGEELVKQMKKLEYASEIIFLDDASPNKEITQSNQEFCNVNQLTYLVSDKNKGRAESRNFLATQAQYSWLLFLDADVFPVEENFLDKYKSELIEDIYVYSGDIVYRRGKGTERKSLRWKYGVGHEEISLEKRKQFSYLYLKSANLLVKKDIFFKNNFPVLKYDYGWEDTLFGLTLQQNGYKIKILKNPVYHEGLEDNVTFLIKTEDAIKNLADLIKNKNPLCSHIRFSQVYLKLKKLRVEKLMLYFFKMNKKKIQNQLLSENPKILLFQIYKLGYLCELLARK